MSGIAALIKSAFPNASSSEIKGRLLGSVVPIKSGHCKLATAGRVNAFKTLTMPPQPIAVIRDWHWIDHDNGEIDPGETAILRLSLESYWLAESDVQLNLTLESPLFTLVSGYHSATLGPDQVTNIDFTVTASDLLQGPNLFEATLRFNGDGWQIERTLCMDSSPLPINIELASSLAPIPAANEKLHINVPDGLKSLTVEVAANKELSLLVSEMGWGVCDPAVTRSCIDRMESKIARIGKSQVASVTIKQPTAGTWYITVLNSRHLEAVDYRVVARTNDAYSTSNEEERSMPPPSTSSEVVLRNQAAANEGGGGALSVLIFLLMWLARGRFTDSRLILP